MPRANSQEDSRISTYLTDIHGRRWFATMEKETMAPTGVIQPCFEAPLIPAPKYLKPGGIKNPTHLGIDYDTAIADLEEKHKEWNRRLRLAAQKMYGEKAGESIENPPPELMHVVGEPPEPTEPLEAAREGNRWVLGFSDIMPAWAKPFFERKRQLEQEASERSRRFPDAEEEGDLDEETQRELVGAGAGEPSDIQPVDRSAANPNTGGRSKARRD
jgi:hypothetical protein